MDLDNPLEQVGVPKWMVQQAITDEGEALERLRRHIHNLIGATGRVYHPDVFPDDPRRTLKQVADAAEQLKTVDDILAWAGFWIHPETMAEAELTRLKALAAEREMAKMRALLDMLFVVDQLQVAGVDGPSELLFGLPTFDYLTPLTYERTYLARVQSSRDVPEITELSPGMDVVLAFSSGVAWDEARGVWRVEHFELEGVVEAPSMIFHYHEVTGDVFEAQLAGALAGDRVGHGGSRTGKRSRGAKHGRGLRDQQPAGALAAAIASWRYVPSHRCREGV